MRSRLLIVTCLLAAQTYAQSKLSIGQYSYLRPKQQFYISPVVQYQSSRNWYAEARYNYEEFHTVSLYGGRTFSNNAANEHVFSYTITPMAGIMEGKLRGASAGLNAEIDFESVYFSTQSQYSMSWQDRSKDFFFSWSEIGCRPLKWLCAGISVQQTKPYHANPETEPGLFVCFSFRQWSFPLYGFLPSESPSFLVAGIIYDWKSPKSGHSRSEKPPLHETSKGIGY